MSRLLFSISLFVAVGTGGVQQDVRTADAVIKDMRAALGGEAVLDTIKTFSVSGSVNDTHGSIRKGMAFEWSALLPEHFMTVKRDSMQAGPMPVDIVYYNGFSGDTLIRRTDSNIPFPDDPGPQTPEAIAERAVKGLRGQRIEFSRITAALFGRPATPGAHVVYIGTDSVEGAAVDVLEWQFPVAFNDYVMRVYVDRATHLPSVIAWQAPPEVVFTTTSTAVTRGNQVISQTPPGPVPSGDPTEDLAPVVWRLVLSDFKTQDGVNWPRRWRTMIGPDVKQDRKLGKFKINPKFDERKFNIR